MVKRAIVVGLMALAFPVGAAETLHFRGDAAQVSIFTVSEDFCVTQSVDLFAGTSVERGETETTGVFATVTYFDSCAGVFVTGAGFTADELTIDSLDSASVTIPLTTYTTLCTTDAEGNTACGVPVEGTSTLTADIVGEGPVTTGTYHERTETTVVNSVGRSREATATVSVDGLFTDLTGPGWLFWSQSGVVTRD